MLSLLKEKSSLSTQAPDTWSPLGPPLQTQARPLTAHFFVSCIDWERGWGFICAKPVANQLQGWKFYFSTNPFQCHLSTLELLATHLNPFQHCQLHLWYPFVIPTQHLWGPAWVDASNSCTTVEDSPSTDTIVLNITVNWSQTSKNITLGFISASASPSGSVL